MSTSLPTSVVLCKEDLIYGVLGRV